MVFCGVKGMHEHAEFGHAAHWMYKDGDTIVKATPMEPPPGNLPMPTAGGTSDDEGDPDSEEHHSQYARPLQELFIKPSPRRPVHVGLPALRVEDGRLLAAVIVGYVLVSYITSFGMKNRLYVVYGFKKRNPSVSA